VGNRSQDLDCSTLDKAVGLRPQSFHVPKFAHPVWGKKVRSIPDESACKRGDRKYFDESLKVMSAIFLWATDEKTFFFGTAEKGLR
jgi:hypothetical protein